MCAVRLLFAAGEGGYGEGQVVRLFSHWSNDDFTAIAGGTCNGIRWINSFYLGFAVLSRSSNWGMNSLRQGVNSPSLRKMNWIAASASNP